jgi:hypothetical protein
MPTGAQPKGDASHTRSRSSQIQTSDGDGRKRLREEEGREQQGGEFLNDGLAYNP